MMNNTLPARDVAFLTALADYLLANGADRAADAIYSAIEPIPAAPAKPNTQAATNGLNLNALA